MYWRLSEWKRQYINSPTYLQSYLQLFPEEEQNLALSTYFYLPLWYPWNTTSVYLQNSMSCNHGLNLGRWRNVGTVATTMRGSTFVSTFGPHIRLHWYINGVSIYPTSSLGGDAIDPACRECSTRSVVAPHKREPPGRHHVLFGIQRQWSRVNPTEGVTLILDVPRSYFEKDRWRKRPDRGETASGPFRTNMVRTVLFGSACLNQKSQSKRRWLPRVAQPGAGKVCIVFLTILASVPWTNI